MKLQGIPAKKIKGTASYKRRREVRTDREALA